MITLVFFSSAFISFRISVWNEASSVRIIKDNCNCPPPYMYRIQVQWLIIMGQAWSSSTLLVSYPFVIAWRHACSDSTVNGFVSRGSYKGTGEASNLNHELDLNLCMGIIYAWPFTVHQPPCIVSAIPSQSVITSIVHVAYGNEE